MSKLLLLPCLILKKVEAVRMNIDLKEIITVFSDSNVSELKLELENLKLYLQNRCRYQVLLSRLHQHRLSRRLGNRDPLSSAAAGKIWTERT